MQIIGQIRLLGSHEYLYRAGERGYGLVIPVFEGGSLAGNDSSADQVNPLQETARRIAAAESRPNRFCARRTMG